MSKIRVSKAFRAMKELGIPESTVKPVLKNLLKLYDKNWELIEEENYRALADAIFDRQEAEAIKQSKTTVDALHSKKTVNSEGLEEEDQEAEESIQPLKRLRLRYQDGQSSSPAAATTSGPNMPLIRPKDEPTDTDLPNTCLPEANASHDLIGSPQPIDENARTGPLVLSQNKGKQPMSPVSLVARDVCDPCQPKSDRSPSHAMKLRDREKGSASPQVSSGEKRPLPDSSLQTGRRKVYKIVRDKVPAPKQKRTASHPLIIPKDEPYTDDMPPFVAPTAAIDPEPSSDRNGTIREVSCLEPSASPSMNEKERADETDTPNEAASPSMNEKERVDETDTPNEARTSGEIAMLSGQCASNLEIAKERADETDTPNEARTSGELAMLSCQCASNLEIASSPFGEVKISLSCNMALIRRDLHMPNLETVLQLVEEKCLRSYKILNPDFSVMNIMKEICQCFLNLRSDGNSEGPATIDEHPTPTIYLLDKSSANEDLGAEGLHLCSLPGANVPQSDTELTLPKTPVVTPCNGTYGVCHVEERSVSDGHGTHIVNKEIHQEETNDLSLVVVDQPLVVTPEMIMLMPLHDVFDIAKGQEKNVITLVNEVNNESPPSFSYIPQNVVFQSAYVNFSLAHIGNNDCSACFGNCLYSSSPCACAHFGRGEFVYTTDGLVKEEHLKDFISMNRDPMKHSQFFCKECPVERSKSDDILEPCKGHIVRKFIKECWLKCGCNKQCGNRVVQRGITRKLQVFMTSEGKGWGLRTLEDLPQGAFVCEFIGEVLTNSEFFDRILRSPKKVKHSYPVVLDADWGAEEVLEDKKALCLDATYYGNVARFINHRCYDSNLVEIPVEVETSDHHYYRLAFFTARKIKAMEELTWDYGIDFDDHDHPIKAFNCECGSKFCRNIRRSRTRASCSRI